MRQSWRKASLQFSHLLLFKVYIAVIETCGRRFLYALHTLDRHSKQPVTSLAVKLAILGGKSKFGFQPKYNLK